MENDLIIVKTGRDILDIFSDVSGKNFAGRTEDSSSQSEDKNR